MVIELYIIRISLNFICLFNTLIQQLLSFSGLLKEFFKFGYNQIAKEDIIVAKNPTHPKENICKRIKGLPGDRIPFQYRQLEKFVPSGAVWVEGDNSTDSRDSRNFGPLPIGNV